MENDYGLINLKTTKMALVETGRYLGETGVAPDYELVSCQRISQ